MNNKHETYEQKQKFRFETDFKTFNNFTNKVLSSVGASQAHHLQKKIIHKEMFSYNLNQKENFNTIITACSVIMKCDFAIKNNSNRYKFDVIIVEH